LAYKIQTPGNYPEETYKVSLDFPNKGPFILCYKIQLLINVFIMCEHNQ
jgi:hypothetical protein